METRKAAMHVGGICLRVGIFVMLVLGLIYLGQTAYRYSRAVFSDEAVEEAPGTRMKVTIPENVSSDQMAAVLQEKGIIENELVFKLQMKMHSFGNSVEAGTYELSTAMAPSEIFAVLSGETEEE